MAAPFNTRVAEKQFVSLIKAITVHNDDPLVELVLVDTTHPSEDKYVDQELVQVIRNPLNGPFIKNRVWRRGILYTTYCLGPLGPPKNAFGPSLDKSESFLVCPSRR
mgnify:CR=1 FL=1